MNSPNFSYSESIANALKLKFKSEYRDRSCIATKSKETRNTEDSNIKIIEKVESPLLACYYNLLKLCAKSRDSTFINMLYIESSVFFCFLTFYSNSYKINPYSLFILIL